MRRARRKATQTGPAGSAKRTALDIYLSARSAGTPVTEAEAQWMVRQAEHVARLVGEHASVHGRPKGRLLLCFLLPPLAVRSYGFGQVLLVTLLTLLLWAPGVIAAWKLNEYQAWGLIPDYLDTIEYPDD